MVKSPFEKLSASIRLTPSRNKNQQNERDEETAPLNNKRIPGSGATSSSPYAASSNDGQNGCVRFAPAGPSMLYQLASSSSDLFNTQQQQQAQHGGAFASQPNFGWRRLEQQALDKGQLFTDESPLRKSGLRMSNIGLMDGRLPAFIGGVPGGGAGGAGGGGAVGATAPAACHTASSNSSFQYDYYSDSSGGYYYAPNPYAFYNGFQQPHGGGWAKPQQQEGMEDCCTRCAGACCAGSSCCTTESFISAMLSIQLCCCRPCLSCKPLSCVLWLVLFICVLLISAEVSVSTYTDKQRTRLHTPLHILLHTPSLPLPLTANRDSRPSSLHTSGRLHLKRPLVH